MFCIHSLTSVHRSDLAAATAVRISKCHCSLAVECRMRPPGLSDKYRCDIPTRVTKQESDMHLLPPRYHGYGLPLPLPLPTLLYVYIWEGPWGWRALHVMHAKQVVIESQALITIALLPTTVDGQKATSRSRIDSGCDSPHNKHSEMPFPGLLNHTAVEMSVVPIRQRGGPSIISSMTWQKGHVKRQAPTL